MSVTLVFDVLVVLLLAAAIGYAIELNRKLTALRRDRGELEALALRFAASAQAAEAGLAQLKLASETAGRTLEQATLKAQALREDLTFLIERGEPLADRLVGSLETAIRQTAAASQPAPAAAPARPVAPKAEAPERDLRRALANLR